MVTLERLSFYNAFTYEEFDVSLDSQGFVFLRGKNGAGKSTPWEVLQHIVYGSTSRGLKKNGIISVAPRDDGYLGELVVRNPEGRWMIRQARNHSKHGTGVQIYRDIDGKWSLTWPGGGNPKKADDAQKLAGQLLGLQLHEFSGCLYLNQSGAHTLIEGTPAERMRYISYLFGCDVYDDMLVTLRERLRAHEDDSRAAEPLEQRVEVFREQRAQLDPTDQLVWVGGQLEQAIQQAARGVRRHRDAYEAAERALAQLASRQRLSDQIQQLTATLDNDAATVDDWLPLLCERHSELNNRALQSKQRAELEQRLAQYPDEPPGDVDALDAQQRQLQNLAERWARRDQLEQVVSSVVVGDATESRYHTVVSEVQRIDDELRRLRAEEQHMQEAVDTFGSGECPTCHQPMSVEVSRQRLKVVRAQLADLHAQQQNAHARKAKLATQLEAENRVKPALAELEGLRGLPPRPPNIEGQLEHLAQQIRHHRELQSAQRVRASLLEQLERLPTGDPDRLTQQLDLYGKEIERGRALQAKVQQIAALNAQLQGMPTTSEADLLGQRDTAQRMEREWQQTHEAASHHQHRIARDLEQAQQLDRDITALTAELDGIRDVRRRVAALKAAIQCTQRLKKRRLHEIIEGVREVLPRYASIMFAHEPNTLFVVDEADESIDLVCRRVVDGQHVMVPVKGLSGGEKQRLNVALTFTLHGLLDANKKPDCLILDEVDRGLDEAGVESLMTLVHEVQGQYGTVIMTSHRAQITGAKFDAVWLVTKDNEVSELRTTSHRETREARRTDAIQIDRQHNGVSELQC